jgi:hypothetical protein
MSDKISMICSNQMKSLRFIVISILVFSGAKGIACEKHPHGHQQPSSDVISEQMKK